MNPIFVQKFLGALSFVMPDLAADLALKIFTTPQRIARPEWEQKIAQSGTSQRIGDKIAIIRWGNPEAPPVLLTHGWAGRGTQLGHLVEPLLNLGYQVITLDGPAHGDSQGRSTSAPQFARAILNTQSHLGELRAIVAHSFGAIATILAFSQGLKAKAAVLVAAPSEVGWIINKFCKRMGLSKRATRSFKKKIEAWVGLPVDSISIQTLGSHLSVPGLVIHDPEDADVPFENAEAYAEYWKMARLITLENVGHRKILKDKSFISVVTDFLGPAWH